MSFFCLAFSGSSASLQLLSLIAMAGSAGLGLLAIVHMAFRIRARDLRHLGRIATENPTLINLRPVFERIAFLATLLPQKGHREWAKKTLRRANLLGEWSPELLETMKLTASIVVFFMGLLLGAMLCKSMPWIMLLIATMVAYFIPDLIVISHANERQNNMRKSLPFVIELIAVSAEAGLAFQQAIANVIDNSKKGGSEEKMELLDEFELLLGGLKVGRTMAEALNNTAERVDMDEFRTFANAVLQAEQLGTPVSETLKSQSQELREKLAARMEAKANQAPVKILFPLIIFIFPVTAWVIIGPVLLRVFFGG